MKHLQIGTGNVGRLAFLPDGKHLSFPHIRRAPQDDSDTNFDANYSEKLLWVDAETGALVGTLHAEETLDVASHLRDQLSERPQQLLLGSDGIAAVALWTYREKREAVSAWRRGEKKTVSHVQGEAGNEWPLWFAHPSTRTGHLSISSDGRILTRVAISIYDQQTSFVERCYLVVPEHLGERGYPFLLDPKDELPTLVSEERLLEAHYSPDGKWIAMSGPNRLSVYETEQDFFLLNRWREINHDSIFKTIRPDGIVQPMTFSPDSSIVVSASGSEVNFWEFQTEIWTFATTHPSLVTALAYSPDGKLLAIGGEDGTVTLWECATAQAKGGADCHIGTIQSMTFSPDSSQFAVGGENGNLVI